MMVQPVFPKRRQVRLKYVNSKQSPNSAFLCCLSENLDALKCKGLLDFFRYKKIANDSLENKAHSKQVVNRQAAN